MKKYLTFSIWRFIFLWNDSLSFFSKNNIKIRSITLVIIKIDLSLSNGLFFLIEYLIVNRKSKKDFLLTGRPTYMNQMTKKLKIIKIAFVVLVNHMMINYLINKNNKQILKNNHH